MKKTIWLPIMLSCLAFVPSAHAGKAFKSGEAVTGMTKQCYYNYLGSTYTITIKSFELCPLTIDV